MATALYKKVKKLPLWFELGLAFSRVIMEDILLNRLARQRNNKRKRDTFREALASLKTFALEDVSLLEDKTEVMLVLHAKYSALVLATVRFIAENLPLIMPAASRSSIISEITENLPVQVTADEFKLLEEIFLKFPGIEIAHDQEMVKTVLSKCQTPLHFVLTPPSKSCLNCDRALSSASAPSHVTLFTLEGPCPGIKLAWKCQACGINYGYCQYGNSQVGYQFYQERRPFVEASNVTYLDSKLCRNQISLA